MLEIGEHEKLENGEKRSSVNVITWIGDAPSSLIETVSNVEYKKKMETCENIATCIYARGYKKINSKLQ